MLKRVFTNHDQDVLPLLFFEHLLECSPKKEILKIGETHEFPNKPFIQFTCLNNIGRYYSSLGQFEKAETYFRRAYNLSKQQLVSD